MIGFITVRAGSSRLHEKCFLSFGSERSVLEHIIKRALNYGIKPIVTTTIESSDDRIEYLCRDLKIDVYRGSVNNKLLRWYEAAKFFGVSEFHSIDADDPFFDGSRMLKSLNLLKESAVDIVTPSKLSSGGVGSEGYSIKTSFLESIVTQIVVETDTEMIHDFVTQANQMAMIDSDLWMSFGSIPRLTLDYLEDYVFLNFIAQKLGNYVGSEELSSYLYANKVLLELNEGCAIKWKTKQNDKSKIKIHKDV